MTLRMTGSWILAVLGALAVSTASGLEAHARGGIVVTTGTTQQTGDPTYEYVFTANLSAGSTLPNGGFFTVYDLPYLTAGAQTSQPNSEWGASVEELGITPTGAVVNDNPNLINVTWEWNGVLPIVASAHSDYRLGEFIIGSTIELTSPPIVTVVFAASLDGSTASNQGYAFINSVPEPSSVILLLAGVGTVPLYWLRERRRQRQIPWQAS